PWNRSRNPTRRAAARSGKALFTRLNLLINQNYFFATVEDESEGAGGGRRIYNFLEKQRFAKKLRSVQNDKT
ncbi:MAG: hypothetical protein AB1424_03790, partial [Thermodesulfobacteriota bacterium]